MSKFFLIIIVSVFSIFTSLSQEEILSFNLDESGSLLKNKDSYSISNNLNGDLCIILAERKEVYATLIDEKFKVRAKIKSDYLKRKYSDILGYNIINNQYTLFASNSRKKKFAAISFNFDTQKTNIQELDFDFNKEKYVEAVNFKNQLYILTATKENALTLRKVDKNFKLKTLKTYKVDASNKFQKLLARAGVDKNDFLEFGDFLFAPLQSNVIKIDNRVPNAIEQTANENKLYQKNNKIYLTIDDEDENYTILHSINLETLNFDTFLFEYPKGNIDDFKEYNSFIIDDKIIQLGSSRKEMKIVVKNFEDEVLKDFYFEKDTPISIKNSPIIQDGQTFVPFVNRREMEETSKFLRKASSGNIGITAYKIDGGYSAIIGGFKEIVTNSGGMMMGGVGVHAAPAGVAIPTSSFNPTFFSYNNYTSTKSVFFNTHFDSNFNYVEKEEEKNIFEKIDDYTDSIKRITAEDVFFHNKILYLGYYDMREKTFHLVKV